MMSIPQPATNDHVLAAVRQWVHRRAVDDYKTAFAQTYHDPADHWTPELMRTIIANYGSPTPYEDGQTFHVTPLEEVRANDKKPTQDVQWLDSESDEPFPIVGYVWFDLPLNGDWSDLTAIFNIRTNGNGLVLELNDIHVL